MIPQDMIPQEKIVAVTRGPARGFRGDRVRGHPPDDQGPDLGARLSNRRPGTSVPVTHYHAHQFDARACAPVHMHEDRRRSRSCATGLVHQSGRSDRHHRFCRGDALPGAEALVRMPAVLRALHALPPFPKGVHHLDTTCMFLIHKGPALDGFIQKFQEANILTKPEYEELFAWHAQLSAAYPLHDLDMASSHNDLFKPDNILFDGNRVWLVDWEAAFLNDRYVDLAVVANLLVTSEADETNYLQQYFGKPPDPYQRARFFLMQQIVHLFYAMAFLWLARRRAGGPE